MALAISLMVASIIVVLGSWMAQEGVLGLRLSSVDNNRQGGLYAAEAGIDEMRIKLQLLATYGNSYSASSANTPTPSPTQSVGSSWPGWPGDNVYYKTATPSASPTAWQTPSPVVVCSPFNTVNGYSEYRIYLVNNMTGSSTITAPDGIQVPGYTEYVRSVGDVVPDPNRTSSTQYEYRIGMFFQKNGLFQYAAMGVNSVTVSGSGNVTGNVATTATSSPAITVSGSGGITGTAYVGANVSDPGSLINGTNYSAAASMPTQVTVSMPVPPASNGSVGGTPIYTYSTPSGTGTASPWAGSSSSPSNTPQASLPGSGATISPGSYGDLTGGSYSLGPGYYEFNSIVMTSGTLTTTSAVTASNPVVIYITGGSTHGGTTYAFYQSGSASIVNTNTVSAALQIYVTTSNPLEVIGNGTSTDVVVYAPSSAVKTTGSGGITGSIIGQTMNVTGAGAVTWDSTLLYTPMAQSGVTVWFTESSHWRM